MDINRVVIFTGHFGSGKTELAINHALTVRKKHAKVAINDLDIINPYYRSRDVAAIFREHDVELIAPQSRLVTSDLPIVSGEIYRVLHDPRYSLIVDAGGDKDGAAALGQYYHEWKLLQPEMWFVLNSNRPYVNTLEGALFTVEQIEQASRLKVTGVINNTNIGTETSMDDILRGLELSQLVAQHLKVPFLYTTISSHLKNEAEDFAQCHEVVFVDRFMKLPWEG